ncbi:MAG: methylmalonyl-CoA mutase family protein [Chloroflexota bacterium]|nr:methylmalonyl-CoA mutase family protein [Chloroflexota bacterium]
MRAFKALQQHTNFDALYEYDLSIRDKQINRLNKARSERDGQQLGQAMAKLQDAYITGENILPDLIEAVKCNMSRGEYCGIVAAASGYSSKEEFMCSEDSVVLMNILG